jgi:phage gp36-like protein
MAYSTKEDLIKASSERDIIQLSDDARAKVIDEGVVTEAISKADAIINSYIGGRYRVPLSSVPLIIGDISTQLAIYFLWERRHRQDMPQSLMEIYKNLIARLKDIHEGRISLPIAEIGGGSEQGNGPTKCNKSKKDRLFPWDGVLNKF